MLPQSGRWTWRITRRNEVSSKLCPPSSVHRMRFPAILILYYFVRFRLYHMTIMTYVTCTYIVYPSLYSYRWIILATDIYFFLYDFFYGEMSQQTTTESALKWITVLAYLLFDDFLRMWKLNITDNQLMCEAWMRLK